MVIIREKVVDVDEDMGEWKFFDGILYWFSYYGNQYICCLKIKNEKQNYYMIYFYYFQIQSQLQDIVDILQSSLYSYIYCYIIFSS